MNQMLDARLETILRAVRPGSVVADVGCDHGFLICALVGDGICPRGYASDIRPGPLAAARRNIRERGLSARIETVLADGLALLPGEQVDDIVIAGMGGEMIAAILTAADWTQDAGKRYILQPMTRAEELRRALYRAGFALLAETAAESAGFVYTVMTAAWSGEQKEVDELFAQTGLLLGQSGPAARAYLQKVCERLEKKATGLERSARGGDTRELRGLIKTIATRAGEIQDE